MIKRGILYFLFLNPDGNKKKLLNNHYAYCKESVKSIKKLLPDMPCILYTNLKPGELDVTLLDDVIYTDWDIKDKWVYKFECLLNSPFEQTLHLDCDTYAAEDFSHSFNMLDKFDLALPLSPYFWPRSGNDIDKCFPEFACGYLLWKKNDKMIKLLKDTQLALKNRSSGCDEPFFRKFLYHSDVRFTVLPWEYTCVFYMPGIVMSSVKIFHGKWRDIDHTVKAINGAKGLRLYSGEKVYTLKQKRGKLKTLDKEIPYGHYS